MKKTKEEERKRVRAKNNLSDKLTLTLRALC